MQSIGKIGIRKWVCPTRITEAQMGDWQGSWHSVWTFERVGDKVSPVLNLDSYSVSIAVRYTFADYMRLRGHDWRPGYPNAVPSRQREQRDQERAAFINAKAAEKKDGVA